MRSFIISTSIGICLIAGCKKQPTDLQKALIKAQTVNCLGSVTTPVGTQNIDRFKTLASLGHKVYANVISKPDWDIASRNPFIITMKLKLDGVKYSCDFQKDASDYKLIKVYRNNTLVFDVEEDLKAREENLKLKRQEDLKKKHQEELHRQKAIRQWVPRKYNNASHKYYIKRHINDKPDSYQSPVINIVCAPEGIIFEYRRWNYVSDQSFESKLVTFLSNGRETTLEFDSSLYDPDAPLYAEKKAKQTKFISHFIKSEAVLIDGLKYRTDDLSQVPCLQPFLEELKGDVTFETLNPF